MMRKHEGWRKNLLEIVSTERRFRRVSLLRRASVGVENRRPERCPPARPTDRYQDRVLENGNSNSHVARPVY